MSYTYPSLSLALKIPNCNFAQPSEVDGVPAWWYPSGAGLVSEAKFEDGPVAGHPRWQRWKLNSGSYGEVQSYFTPTGLIAGVGMVPMTLYTLLRVSGCGGGSSIAIVLRRCSSYGVQQEQATLLTITGNLSSWTMTPTMLTPTFASASVRFNRLAFLFTKATTVPTLDIAFVGVGLWNSSVSRYIFPNYVEYQGSSPCVFLDGLEPDVGLDGEERWNTGIRRPFPRVGSMAFDWVSDEHGATPNSFGQQLRYARARNRNRSFEVSGVMPEGGRYPLILSPGTPGWPAVMQCRFADDRLPMRYSGDWIRDPAKTGVVLNFIEEL